MTKEEFDKKYVGEKLVVNCETEQLANQFLKLAHDFGYEWADGDSYIDNNNWNVFKFFGGYCIYEGNIDTISYFARDGYKIIEYKGEEKMRKSQTMEDFKNRKFYVKCNTREENFEIRELWEEYGYNFKGTYGEFYGHSKHLLCSHKEGWLLASDDSIITVMPASEFITKVKKELDSKLIKTNKNLILKALEEDFGLVEGDSFNVGNSVCNPWRIKNGILFDNNNNNRLEWLTGDIIGVLTGEDSIEKIEPKSPEQIELEELEKQQREIAHRMQELRKII